MKRHPRIETARHAEGIGQVTIRTAQLDDLPAIDALQRQWSNAVGFIPRTALRDRIQRHHAWLITAPGAETGYLMHAGGIRVPYIRLSQIAVRRDLLRNGIGTALLDVIRSTYPTLPIIADVAEELPLNPTLRHLGANLLYTARPDTARQRAIHRWQWNPPPPLQTGAQPAAAS